jgi:hypothetical protein
MPGRGTAGIFRLPQGRNVAISWIALSRSRWGRGTSTQGITALPTTDASNTTARAWLSDLHSEDGLSALSSGRPLAIAQDVEAPPARFLRLDEFPSGVSRLAP